MMKECIRDTKAVLLVITTNDNIPRCSLSLDSTTTVVQAMQELRASKAGPSAAGASQLGDL